MSDPIIENGPPIELGENAFANQAAQASGQYCTSITSPRTFAIARVSRQHAGRERVVGNLVRAAATVSLATMLCPPAYAQDAGRSSEQGAAAAPAKVEPALEGVFRAFKGHPVVALGDAHGLAVQMAFYTTVVRDRRFARDVRNLVVEFGAASQQQVIDRYVAGETVPYVELREVWNDTVGWVPPPALIGFAKFFAAVRDVNKSLPANRKIKVWLGGPPLDWTSPSRDEIRAAAMARDTYPAALLRDKILAKGAKALVIYGAFHFAGGPMLKGQLDATNPGAMFVILPYAPPFQYPACAPLLSQVAAIWPKPALATRSERGPDAKRHACFSLSPPAASPGPGRPGPGAPGPGGPRPDRSWRGGPGLGTPEDAGTRPERPGQSAPRPGQAGLTRSGPPTIDGDGVLFLAPLEQLGQGPRGPLEMMAQGRFLPDYLFDPELRREIRRRSNLGGPPLLPQPAGLAIRKADYAFDLDAPGFREQIDRYFAVLDRNSDGVITNSEYDDPSD